MSNLSTPFPTVLRMLLGSTDVVPCFYLPPFFLLFFGCYLLLLSLGGRHKLLKLENCWRCVCASCVAPFSFLFFNPNTAANFAHDSTWFCRTEKKYIYCIYLLLVSHSLSLSLSLSWLSLLVAIKSIFDWCQYYYHFIMAIYLSGCAAGAAWVCHSIFSASSWQLLLRL